MKIILLKDVKKIGTKNQVINVKDGFALNYLIPNKLATVANDDKVKQIEVNIKKQKINNQKTINELDKIVDKLKDKIIDIKKEASDKGKLFAAVSPDEILNELKKKFKTELDKSKVKMDKSLKEIGEHPLELKIGNRKINIKINITKK